jgi:hypothetical protein
VDYDISPLSALEFEYYLLQMGKYHNPMVAGESK